MSGDASAWFRRFHGERPRQWLAAEWRRPEWVADLGPLVAVSYLGPRQVVRQHTFAPGARPVLVRDDRGALGVVGGDYKVEEVGIVDNRLTVVDPRTRFTRAGVPVHGRQVPRGEVATVPRANPMTAADLVEGARRVGDAVGVGGVALMTVGGSDMVVERTAWGEGARAAAQLALIVPGAVLCATAAQRIGAGVVVGAIVGGGLRLARHWQWDRMAAAWADRVMPNRRTEETAPAAGIDDRDGRVEATVNARNY